MFARFCILCSSVFILSSTAQCGFVFVNGTAEDTALTAANTSVFSFVDGTTGITATFTATGGILDIIGPDANNFQGLSVGSDTLQPGESLSIVFDQDIDLTSLVLSHRIDVPGTFNVNVGGTNFPTSSPNNPGTPPIAFQFTQTFAPVTLASGTAIVFTGTAPFTLNQVDFTAGTFTAGGVSVPEPSSFAMLGLIAIGLILRRKSRLDCVKSTQAGL